MPKYITFLLLCLAFSTTAQQKIDEELIIFVQKTTDSEFTQQNIKELEADMKNSKIPTKIINIDKTGAPKEVGYTPYIVYRNYLGNKVYKGRYTSHKRILNFIRTVRQLPKEDINYEEKDVFVWKHERANLIFKLKITDLQGSIPDGFDEHKFKKEYLQGLKKGFAEAHFSHHQRLHNSEEMFYCNFYPYRGEDGKVYVSTEIFSHYDCINPIYQKFKTPNVGNSIVEGFEVAANNTFTEIKRVVVESELGDALNFVTKAIPVISWDKLKLKKLTPPKNNMHSERQKVTFPKEWTLLGSIDEGTPMLAFNFPPPLRQYGGEIKKATGSIILTKDQSLESSTGKFVVDVNSLEMGVSSLNSAVKQSMLFIDKYPNAQLVFKKIQSKDFTLELGKITRVQIEADLTIVDKTGSVLATSQFEPFLNDKGELLLHVTTQFVAEDLTGIYQIDGPDGPDEANNKMLFNANFLMKGIPPTE